MDRDPWYEFEHLTFSVSFVEKLIVACAAPSVRRTIRTAVRSEQYGDRKMNDDATYICDSCGEEIVIPIDLSEGTNQTYVEDCPVCCNSNVIHVECDEEGNSRAWGEREF